MNKHICKIIGLLILTLLVTGCTVFVRVNRPNTYLEGWVYESNYYEDLIVSASNQAPRGYSPLKFRDVEIHGNGYATTARTNANGYFRTGNLKTGEAEIIIDYGRPKVRLTTYIYRGKNTLGSSTESMAHYIFVGIDEYPDMDVKNYQVSAYDAEDMKEFLVDNNAIQASSVKVLTDANATKSEIRKAILSAADRASRQDHLVFYFSGYADEEIRYDDWFTERLDHLVPYDGQDYGDENVIKDSVITDRDLANWLAGFPNDNITVILDVAYAGTFVDGSISPQSIPDLSLQALLGPGYTVLGATNRNARTEIYVEEHNSTFTYYLLEGLGRGSNSLPADSNNNGRVTAQELFNYARDRMAPVPEYPIPIIRGNNTNNVIYVAK